MNGASIGNQFMPTNLKKRPSAEELRRQLSLLRNDSVIAARKRDFRTVARLTVATASINRMLSDLGE